LYTHFRLLRPSVKFVFGVKRLLAHCPTPLKGDQPFSSICG